MKRTAALARADADAARVRLEITLSELKSKLRPQSLAESAVESVKTSTTTLALRSVDTARERPALAAAIAGAIGLFVARHRIGAMIHARRHPSDAEKDETAATPAS